MGELHDRMRDDLRLRNYADGTIQRCLDRARKFVAHFMRPPGRITRDEVRGCPLHLLNERKLSGSRYRAHRAAIKFLYEVTLGLPFKVERILPPKRERRPPEVLSRDEVLALLRSAVSLKHRVTLTTMCAAGLRISEACGLRVSDIDSRRMTVRVRRGKGAKDRCVMLPPTLLVMPSKYWLAARPGSGDSTAYLFPGRRPGSHLAPDTVTKSFHEAAALAGVFREYGPSYRGRFRVTARQRAVMRHIESCSMLMHLTPNVGFGTCVILNEKGRPADTKCVRALGSGGRPWTLQRTLRLSRRCS
jgi:integrase